LWFAGALSGKYYGLFISTGAPGGGQESTAIAVTSSFVHQGKGYVLLGYKNGFEILANIDEVRGGSPWGAGTFASVDSSRQPSELELKLAQIQGKMFFETFSKVSF
jgi:NAD(P)H dehydrogenase (quinone)